MKKIYILFSLLCAFAIFITITSYYNGKSYQETPETPQKTESFILRSEDNTVRLYQGEKLLKEYDNIVTSTLPLMDQDNLKSGIIIETYSEVMQIIEDFDG